MDISATLKNARMSPQKFRALSRIVRGLPVQRAQVQLDFTTGKAADLLSEVLKSAVANADHNYSLKAADLVVKDIMINSGFVMKRIMPVSRGMAHPIMKRTAHITVVVGLPKDGKKSKAIKAKISEISTITAEEFASRSIEEKHETSEEVLDDPKNLKAPGGAPKPDKSMEAFQKTKMMQQGGDAKKTSRRQGKKGGGDN